MYANTGTIKEIERKDFDIDLFHNLCKSNESKLNCDIQGTVKELD